jgi:hypothetical protein
MRDQGLLDGRRRWDGPICTLPFPKCSTLSEGDVSLVG